MWIFYMFFILWIGGSVLGAILSRRSRKSVKGGAKPTYEPLDIVAVCGAFHRGERVIPRMYGAYYYGSGTIPPVDPDLSKALQPITTTCPKCGGRHKASQERCPNCGFSGGK